MVKKWGEGMCRVDGADVDVGGRVFVKGCMKEGEGEDPKDKGTWGSIYIYIYTPPARQGTTRSDSRILVCSMFVLCLSES